MKNKSKKILKILKREKTKKILSYWSNKSGEWIRSNELRNYFVKKDKNLIYRENNTFFNSETKKIYNFKPKTVYNYDSQLYRDLNEMVEIGILDNKKNRFGSYYRPKKEFKSEGKSEGIRIQNKEALDLFPSEKIIDYNIFKKEYQNHEYIDKKIILYGISKNLLKNMPKEKKDIKNLIENLNQTLDKIQNKKELLWKKENEKRLKQILNKTKKKKLKNFLNDQNIGVLGRFSVNINLSKYDKNSVDLTKSKEHFFLQFIYGITTQEANISNLENNEQIIDFIRFMDNLGDIEYGKLWCKTFFHKEYDLTRKDIHKLIRWGWNNRDFFDMFFPMDFALSVYGSREDNELIRM